MSQVYMYVPYMMDDDGEYQSDEGPTKMQAEEVIANELKIYRFTTETGLIELFTPIDDEDFDNWSRIMQTPPEPKEESNEHCLGNPDDPDL